MENIRSNFNSLLTAKPLNALSHYENILSRKIPCRKIIKPLKTVSN